jgi:hypothetical protein
VQLRRVDIGKLMEAQRGLMTVHALGLLVSVSRPQRPNCEVRMIRLGKEGQPINAAVLTDPVSGLNMVRMSILSESGNLRLLGREKPLLRLGDLVETLERILPEMFHNTILQL